jgi:predicted AAA+ superfamily ATPase
MEFIENYAEEHEGVVDPEYKRYLTDLHEVTSKPAGRRVLAHILGRLGTFDSAWSAKNAQMAKATVLRDFGQEVIDDLAVASAESHDEIQRSMRISRKAGLTYQIFNTDKEK